MSGACYPTAPPSIPLQNSPEHRLKRLVLGLIVASTSVTAADLAGQWTLNMDRDFRGNPAVPVECTFERQRTDLTVKCGTANGIGEMKGEVRGRKVKWGLEMTGIPPVLEDRLVLTYSGELNDSETTVKGTWRLTSSVLDEKGTFEATKKREAHQEPRGRPVR